MNEDGWKNLYGKNLEPTKDNYAEMIVHEIKDKMVEELKEKNNERDYL